LNTLAGESSLRQASILAASATVPSFVLVRNISPVLACQ
jgi:hypothetical protein